MKKLENITTEQALEEIENLRGIVAHCIPKKRDLPTIEGYEFYGEMFPLGDEVGRIGGGDLLTFFNYREMFNFERLIQNARKENNYDLSSKLEETSSKGGILMIDVMGHAMSDSALAMAASLMFTTSLPYEIEANGEVTGEAIGNLKGVLKNRFTSRTNGRIKLLTLLFGEISPNGTFKYVSAAHPTPILYSPAYNGIIELDPSQSKTSGFVGLEDSPAHLHWRSESSNEEENTINEIRLIDKGDLLLIHTDGLSEHASRERKLYIEDRLPKLLSEIHEKPAREIVSEIYGDMKNYAPITDDVTLAVIKKNN